MLEYEIMIIFDSNIKNLDETIIFFSNIIENNELKNNIINIDKIGLKKFSYLIKKQINGIYIIYNIKIEKNFIKNIENKIKINENVVRYLITKIYKNKLKNKLYNIINYKNIIFLKKFLTDNYKILPQKITKFPSKFQRKLAKEIKKSRYMALLPYITKHLII